MTPPMLCVRDLGRSYAGPGEDVQVLNGISLSANAGERLVITGPSGCGKTTLLHQLALLDRPSAGEVELNGESTAAWSESRRSEFRARHIGMVFQHFHTLPYHSVRKNIELAARYLSGQSADQGQVDALLESVGLTHRKSTQARFLSGGEKQRLCIARALYGKPSVLLADEPTGNLDPENSDRIQHLFRDLCDSDTLVIVATHDPSWRAFATRELAFAPNGSLEEVL